MSYRAELWALTAAIFVGLCLALMNIASKIEFLSFLGAQ
jgi:hypothetical protein